MTQSWEYQEFNEQKIKEHKTTNYIIKNIKHIYYTFIVIVGVAHLLRANLFIGRHGTVIIDTVLQHEEVTYS